MRRSPEGKTMLRKRQPSFGAIVALGLASAPVGALQAAPADDAPAYVAVLPFANTAGKKLKTGKEVQSGLENGVNVDVYAEHCRTGVEELLVGAGVPVVERERIARALEEMEFGRSGLVAPETATGIGRITGAGIMVTGTIRSLRERTVRIDSYQIKRRKTALDAEVQVKVFDASTAQIRYQRTFRGSVKVDEDLFRKESGDRLELDAINDALAGLADDAAFVAATRPPPKLEEGEVAVQVRSEPSGADVEVDGILEGQTPCAVRGAEGDVVELRVTRPGFEPWSKKIRLSAKGMSVLDIALVEKAAPVAGGG